MNRANHRRRESGPVETRPFQEGDDESWIDWGLTATEGRMMVRAPVSGQHAPAGQAPPGPRISPKHMIAGASAVAVAALAIGVVATSGDDDPSPGTPPATTTSRTATTGTGPRPPVRRSAGNLVQNPSFEKNVAGWNAWQATISRRDDNRAPHGSYIVRVTSTRGTAFAFAQNEPVAVTGWPAGARVRGRAVVRAANARSVGKVVVLRLRQRDAAGKPLGEAASRPVRLTRAFAPVVVIGSLKRPGARVDVRVSGESGWFKTRIIRGMGVDVDMLGMRLSAAPKVQKPKPKPKPKPKATTTTK
ncbi:MAG: hypothetical protein IT200_16455 [Thermoleophilia bacterium]|nr:hypothetical protein [Thermoleophilia bacterium]